MSYKKRAKGSWNAGKSHKAESNRSERQFEPHEIQQALHELDPKFTYKYKGKRKRNHKERLRHEIKWYNQRIKHYEQQLLEKQGSWMEMFIHSFRDTVTKLEKKWLEQYGDEEI